MRTPAVSSVSHRSSQRLQLMTRVRTHSRFLVAAAFSAFSAFSAMAQSKPLITPKDYGKWELLGQPRLSPKGDWVAVNVNRVDEENELRIRGGAKDTTITVK